MSSEAVTVSHIGKRFEIYEKPHHRLLQGLFRGRRQFFREFWALRDVSFAVPKGETLAIIGRNGSGKSTLLQIICGTLAPTMGNVDVAGRVAALLELGTGFNPEFTGRENVFLNATVLGLTREETAARFDDIAAFADIGSFIDQPVKTYSSGMYVRLAFSVIAHVDADILIVDEALSVGDAFFSQKCMRFLRRFREKGTLLFVSHDSGAVVNLCNRAVWLEQGQIRGMGDARVICDQYMEAVYEAQQGASAIAAVAAVSAKAAAAPTETNAPADAGAEEADRVSPEAQREFGVGGAMITHVSLRDGRGARVRLLSGEEPVTLTVTALASREIAGPIIGFTVRDRLGQSVFAENTFQWTPDTSLQVQPDEQIEARFTFDMPRITAGDYTISVSVAEGTQQDHIQHHWIHDALVFSSQPDRYCLGLVGLQVREATLQARRPRVREALPG
jgi:lipopolysaccharide transport system ATP-binding protein